MRAVKASYSAIITALDHIYSESHETEALGIKKALCKKSTIAARYLSARLCSPTSRKA